MDRKLGGLNPALALLLCCGAAGACEYKTVMTDADIEACRREPAQAAPEEKLKPAPTPPRKWTSQDQAKFEFDQMEQSLRWQKAEQERREAESSGGLPKIGITFEEFKASAYYKERAAYCGGGHTNRTISARGTHDQLVCSGDYFYFDNGVLTAIQLSK